MSSNLQVRATKGDGYEALAGYFGNLRRPSRRGKQRRGSNYPWCAHLGTGFESTNCGFTTFQQCMDTVSGIGGFCQPNTEYQVSSGPRSLKKLQSRYRY